MSTVEQAQTACVQGWFQPRTLTPLQAGRINDSYRVQGAQQDFVLQAINPRVFADAVQLMAQLQRVVRHLNGRRAGWVPELLERDDGSAFLESAGRVWRVWRFVAGETLQPEHCARPLLLARLRAAGEAFAATQVMLETLPGATLKPGIAHYHDLDFFLRQFDSLAEGATEQWRERIAQFREQPADLKAHDGYIHGDCKPDNLLFVPDSAEVSAVLDLDTVMWGTRALDFGDLVRSSVWQQERFSLPLFNALLTGYAKGQRHSAHPVAADQLLQAPEYVSFMLSVRYLNDHLRGDVEFKVRQRGDNLQRAERQFQRTLALRDAGGQMQGAIDALN